MTKSRKILLVVVGVALLAMIALKLFAPREPYYKGKPYSAYFQDWVHNNPESAEATRALGTNALPCLVRWIQYEPSPWKEKLRDVWNRSMSPGNPPESFRRYWLDKKLIRADRALEGFRLLGSQAEPAIPELARLATNTSPYTAMRAITALSYLGPKGLPPLLQVITNRALLCDWAIQELRHGGQDARPAIPALVECLTDKDDGTVAMAAGTLGELQMEPILVVPALADLLRHVSPDIRMGAVEVLRSFGAQARPAAAALRETAAHDADFNVRSRATNTLQRIGLEVQDGAMPQKGP